MRWATPIIGYALRFAVGWAIARGWLKFEDDNQTQEFISALETGANILFTSLFAGSLAKVAYDRARNPSSAAKPEIVPTTDPSAPGPTVRPSAIVKVENGSGNQ